jgi:hypothetical protein
VVARVVINDQDLEVVAWKLLIREASERLSQEVRTIVRRDRNRDFDGGIRWHTCKRPACRRFGRPRKRGSGAMPFRLD